MPTPADREKSLEAALAQIDRQFGKGSVMRLGSEDRAPVEVIPTGSIALDVALGVGGLPRGRIVEIYGPESSGKTTLTLHAIANAQRSGGIAAFIDAEHALDPEYAKKLGVDIDALLVSQPDTGEQALEIADMLVRSGSIDLVVIDSVAALVPRAEIEGEMGDSHVGLQARLMSQALRKLTGGLNQTQTTMIFINQLREKIGVFFGSPETTAGGKALKFYASVRLDIRRIETLKDGTDAVGNRTRVKVVKNKMAPPFKQAEFDILYGTGISREGSLIDFGVEHAIVRKSGAWYTYDGDQLGQGKEKARQFLIDNPDLAAEIEHKILTKLGVGAGKAAAEQQAGVESRDARRPERPGAWASGLRGPASPSSPPGSPHARTTGRASRSRPRPIARQAARSASTRSRRAPSRCGRSGAERPAGRSSIARSSAATSSPTCALPCSIGSRTRGSSTTRSSRAISPSGCASASIWGSAGSRPSCASAASTPTTSSAVTSMTSCSARSTPRPSAAGASRPSTTRPPSAGSPAGCSAAASADRPCASRSSARGRAAPASAEPPRIHPAGAQPRSLCCD